ncbi:MAG: trypsin-like peptidase domain-containing protein [Pirellulales bacterium]|nr:trypsin-like peptidase domain-containing protein [Pirellulales bacterium]
MVTVSDCHARPFRSGLLGFVLLSVFLGWPGLAGAEPPADSDARTALYAQLERQATFFERQADLVKTVAKLIGPTVVHIEADVSERRSLRHGKTGQVEESGSGVIIEHKGKHYILTNRHVVFGAEPEAIRVHLADRRTIRPTKVWEDAKTDIAVLAVDAPNLVAARIGRSEPVEIGDFVLAVGSPFGLSHSVTFGIVSARHRHDLRLGGKGVEFQDFLQTDAAINPGNSGGPLVNLRGEVIGINTAIASSGGGNEGIGFAIPSALFMNIARQLIEKGNVERAFLGVTIDARFGPTKAAEIGLPTPVGGHVTGVIPDSPAAEAKLRVDDVILRFQGVPVDDDDHLVNLIGLTELDKEVTMVVFRDRKQITVKARLKAKKANPDQ